MSGLYINSAGISKYNINNNWIELTVSTISSINVDSINTEIPGAKAVYDCVKDNLLSAKQYTDEQITSALISSYNYTDKEVLSALTSSYQYTDEQVNLGLTSAYQYTNIAADTVLTTAYQYTDTEVSGKADKAEFTNIIPEENIKNGLYITDENAVNIYDGQDWRNLSKALSDTFDIDGDLTETVPTLYAVSSFVEEKLENIDIPEIPPSNLIFVDAFPSTGDSETLYISKLTKEAGFYTENGLQKINIDIDIADTLTETTPKEQIPCAGAVREYVNENIKIISDEFNAEISGKTELVIGDIPSARCGKYILYR
jgi:hypothetical protein